MPFWTSRVGNRLPRLGREGDFLGERKGSRGRRVTAHCNPEVPKSLKNKKKREDGEREPSRVFLARVLNSFSGVGRTCHASKAETGIETVEEMGASESTDRRREPRYPLVAAGQHVPPRCGPCRVLNLSSSGCTFESPHPLGPIDSVLHLDLFLPTRNHRASLSARIVWEERQEPARKERFRYGVAFAGLPKEGHPVLSRYLESLRRCLHLARLDEAWRSLKTGDPGRQVTGTPEARAGAPASTTSRAPLPVP